MKRATRHVVGLPDLPLEVLDLILSLLGTLSLAAVRLACQALQDAATRCRRRVVIGNRGASCWDLSPYTATARASPRVLQLMHTFLSSLDSKDEAGAQRIPRINRFLESVGAELVFLQIGCVMDPSKGELLPEVLVSHMRELESLHLDGPGHRTILRRLPALPHLKDLELGFPCYAHELHEVCSTLALSRLAFENDDTIDLQHAFAMLASGKTSGLQELVLFSPGKKAQMQNLSRLIALTALTALTLKVQCRNFDFEPLSCLAGLKRLYAGSLFYWLPACCVERLSPLTTLTGLTHLDLPDYQDHKAEYVPPSDVSVLSALTALRVLRCSYFYEAELVDGDPLPVQLRFLRSSPALEVLDLGFQAPFWSLLDASSCAVQEAACGLLSLKRVTICIEGGKVRKKEQYYPPLSAFAAAPSIEAFSYSADGYDSDEYTRLEDSGSEMDESMTSEGGGPDLEVLDDTRVEAWGCFKALSKLQSLSLEEREDARLPYAADLLAGLPSSHLTYSRLGASTKDATLVQEIARFRDLQHLSLSEHVRLASLDPLSNLKCLTRLDATSYAGTDTCGRALQLETAISEYGRRVGVPVSARVTCG